MAFLNLRGITLHYHVDGAANAPALVFINALGTDYRIWDALLACQPGGTDDIGSHRLRVVQYDKRGHGLSDAPAAPYRLTEHTTDLMGLLDYLQIENAMLAGISVGGMIALQCAAAWPDRIRGLVLCDTAPKIGSQAMWDERIHALRTQGLAQLAEPILARWFAPSFREARPESYQGYHNMLTRTPLEGYVGTCAALRDADLWSIIGSLNLPVLVLCGAADQATPPEQARAMAQAIPGARCEIIADAGHLPCIEQPAAMVQALAKFLREQGYG